MSVDSASTIAPADTAPTVRSAFRNLREWVRRGRGALGPVLMALATMAFFKPALDVFFTNDDFWWIKEARYTMSTVPGFLSVFAHSSSTFLTYRPLTANVYFWVCWHLFGSNPVGYHVLLLATHALTAGLVYALLRRLSGADGWAAEALPAGGTAFWAFSTTHYTAVAWVSAFSETGAMFCGALTLLAIVYSKPRLTVVCYVATLLSNETMTSLPLLALCYLVIWKRASLRSALIQSAGLWITFALYVVARVTVLGLHPAGGFALVISPIAWAQLTGQSIVLMLGWSDWLGVLLHFAPAPWPTVARVTIALAGATLALLLAAGIFQFTRRLLAATSTRAAGAADGARLVLLGICWLVGGLTPILPIVNDFSPYNTALSMIGLAVVVVGVGRIAGKFGPGLVCAAGCAFVLLNALVLFGNGGLVQVEGSAQLARASAQAYAAMSAAEARHPGRLRVLIESDSATDYNLASGITYFGWETDLVAPGSTVCYVAPPTSTPPEVYTTVMAPRTSVSYTSACPFTAADASVRLRFWQPPFAFKP